MQASKAWSCIRSKRINAISKSGTVTSTLGTTLTEFKKKFEYKADKTGLYMLVLEKRTY
jgi:ribosomal protein L1